MGENTLLNQNIKVEEYGNEIKLINMSNGMELARFSSDTEIHSWINQGWFMNKEQWDEKHEM